MDKAKKIGTMNFCSDNVTEVCPEIMAALIAANEGAMMPYGGDEYTQRLETKFSLIFETPWESSPTFASTLSLLYLGVIATGLAWLIRFRILTVNGLVFQTQVAYLIPIFGIIFGYFLMNEIITWRVLISLVIILIGIYIFKKNNKTIVS